MSAILFRAQCVKFYPFRSIRNAKHGNSRWVNWRSTRETPVWRWWWWRRRRRRRRRWRRRRRRQFRWEVRIVYTTVMLHERHGISNQRQFVKAYNKENIRSPLYCMALCEEKIHRRSVDFPHKGTLMQKACLSHEATIIHYSLKPWPPLWRPCRWYGQTHKHCREQTSIFLLNILTWILILDSSEIINYTNSDTW